MCQDPGETERGSFLYQKESSPCRQHLGEQVHLISSEPGQVGVMLKSGAGELVWHRFVEL